MSPDMLIRISARNDIAKAFGDVVADARMAGTAVAQSAEVAAAGLRQEALALQLVERSSRAAAMNSRNLLFQLNDVGVSLASGMSPLLVLVQQGSQIAQIWGPEEGGVGRALRETGNLLVGLVTKFWPVTAALAAGGILVGGLTAKINAMGGAQVNFGNVAMASWQLFAEGVVRFVGPAVHQVQTWLGQLVDWFTPVFKMLGNGIVGTLVGAYNTIIQTWDLLPDAFASLFVKAMNGAIDIVQDGINAITGALKNIPGLGSLGTVDLSGFKGVPSGADTKVAGIAGGAFSDAFGTDYMGQAFDAIAGRAKKLATATTEADKLGKAMKGANDNAKLLSTGLASVGGVADAVAQGMRGMVDNALGSFGQLTGALGKLFEDNKGFAVATAVLQGLQGVAYALGSAPPPWNFINAAAVGIEAAANVANILSTNKNTKSMPRSGGTGGAGAGAGGSAAAAPKQAVNITLDGRQSALYSGQQVGDLLDQLAAAMNDGHGTKLVTVLKRRVRPQ